MKNPLTSPAYIKELMRRHGFTFSKALGQNFLINGAIPAKIAEAAEIGPDTGVIEIGPGFGTLTWELCRRAKKVVAIELDGRLPAVLRETLRDFDNWTVIEADAPSLLYYDAAAAPSSGKRRAHPVHDGHDPERGRG